MTLKDQNDPYFRPIRPPFYNNAIIKLRIERNVTNPQMRTVKKRLTQI